jgi:hypothetical protein
MAPRRKKGKKKPCPLSIYNISCSSGLANYYIMRKLATEENLGHMRFSNLSQDLNFK